MNQTKTPLTNTSPENQNSSFLPGFKTMFHQEFSLWWGKGRRWIHVSILTTIFLVAIPVAIAAFLNSQSETFALTAWDTLISIYLPIAKFALPLLAILLTAGNISQDIKTGTAEWILSKPITRDSFVLAKLFATFLGIFTTTFIIPLIVLYVMGCMFAGSLVNPFLLLYAMSFVLLYTFLLITLTTLISCNLSWRAGDIGLALILVFIQFVYNIVISNLGANIPTLEIPEYLLYIAPSTLNDISNNVLQAMPWNKYFYIPLLVTGLLIITFIFLSLFSFRRREF